MATSFSFISSRTFRRLAGLVLLAGGSLTGLVAQDQSTSATLTGWSATGAVVQAKGAITLPAGGQLVRTYPAGEILVNVLSRPYFSAKADGRPILEAGPASLVFVRNDSGGGVVMLGDQMVLLPSAIPLGADGRSVKSLDLSLYFDPASNQAVLVLDGATYPFTAKASSAQFDVAISAGGEADWSLDRLEVIAPNQKTDPSGADANIMEAKPDNAATDFTRAQLAVAEVGRLAQSRQRRLAASAYASGDNDQEAEKDLALINRRKPDTAAWALEMAQMQVQLAIQAAQEGDTRTADRIVRSALQQIAQSVNRASADESEIAANALELAGFVQERFLGDLTQARQSYRQAVEKWADDDTAKKAVERLDAIEREAKSKTPTGQGR